MTNLSDTVKTNSKSKTSAAQVKSLPVQFKSAASFDVPVEHPVNQAVAGAKAAAESSDHAEPFYEKNHNEDRLWMEFYHSQMMVAVFLIVSEGKEHPVNQASLDYRRDAREVPPARGMTPGEH